MTDYTPHEAPASNPQALPAVIPPKLVGRDPALKQIYSQLKQGNPVHLHGQPGVGKTAIAATLASAYANQPGGVLWLTVDMPRLEELLVMVGRAYGVEEIINSDNPVALLGAAENTLRQHKPLIVLDGRVDADSATRFITRCAPNLPAMILNESTLEGPWATMEVSPLAIADAVNLFKLEARITDSSTDADIAKIVGTLSNIPLGIVIAAKAMLASKQQPAAYANVLEQVAKATNANGAVVAIAASFRGLTNALQGVLLLLGATFHGSASADLMSLISGAPADNIKQAMNIISQLKLIETTSRNDEPYYSLHPLIHRFLQTWLRTSDRLEALQTKVRDAIVAYAEQNNEGDADSQARLATEMDSFLATANWANEEGQTSVVSDLVQNLRKAGNFVSAKGYTYELLMLRNLETGSTSAFPGHPEPDIPATSDEQVDDFVINAPPEDLPTPEELLADDDDESEPLETIAPPTPAVVDLETTDLNQLRNTLAQLKQANDSARQADVLKTIGQVQVSQGMNNEAVGTYTELLSLYEENGENQGVLETIDMLSALMVKNDNSQAAVMQASRGAKLAEELGDDITRMHLLTTIGDARQQMGESDIAITDYTNALTITRTKDDSQNEGIILYKLGYAQLDGSDPETAIETWEQALMLFKEQDKRDYEGRTMGALGSAYGDLDRWSEALSFHTSALFIAREVGDKEEEAQQLASLGYASVQANDLAQAVMRYRQALHLAFTQENDDDIVSNTLDLARLLVESRKHLRITKLLIDRALQIDSTDVDVVKLTERVNSEIILAEAYETPMLAVNGTAEQYAANAYSLLEA